LDLTKLTDKELLSLEKRTSYEVAKYKNFQNAKKIQLNSAYGSIGNQFFRFYSLPLAESVTKNGQLVIQWIEKAINVYLNKICKTEGKDYIIAGDTDSLVLALGDIVSQFPKDTPIPKIVKALDKFSNENIRPEIDKATKRLAEYTNAFVNRMNMKRECIADKGIWTRKKRYILNVYDAEGVYHQEPELKIMGLEAVRSSTPQVIREKMKACIKLVMQNTEADVQKFIKEGKEIFRQLPPEDVAFPKTCNGLDKYSSPISIYIKGAPFHVKGALIYNNLLKQKKLDKVYRTIKEGDKGKTLYLIEPNPLHVPAIGFIDLLPVEFGIHAYVDFDKQYQKTFVDPMEKLLTVIGWSVEERFTFDEFFGDQ